jgi:hypothetical protein
MTDEEQRLRDAVVERTMEWRATITNNATDLGDIDNAQFEVEKAADALISYRTRSSSPEPTPRVEPPEEFRHIPFHWVIRPMCTINPWPVFWSQVGGCWQMDGRDWSQEETAKYEWRYVGPCVYSSTLPNNCTAKERAAIAELMESQGLTEAQVMRQALRHYQTLIHRLRDGETCTWSGDRARAKEFSGNIPLDTRIEPTDEALDAFADSWWPPFSATMQESRRGYLRAALGHFSPAQQEITDTLLLQLRSIALTRDPEVYLTDARKAVEGVKP